MSLKQRMVKMILYVLRNLGCSCWGVEII